MAHALAAGGEFSVHFHAQKTFWVWDSSADLLAQDALPMDSSTAQLSQPGLAPRI